MGVKKGAKVDEIDKKDYNADTDTYYYWTSTKGEGDEEKTVYHRVKKEDAVKLPSNYKESDDLETWTDQSIGDNGLQYQGMSSGFFKLLKETLQQGINFGAMLSVGDGASGMSLTVSENGKQRATYVSYDPVDTEDHSNNSNPAAVKPFNI